jgi:hypothetical protein
MRQGPLCALAAATRRSAAAASARRLNNSEGTPIVPILSGMNFDTPWFEDIAIKYFADQGEHYRLFSKLLVIFQVKI